MLKELTLPEIKTLLRENTVAHICFFDGVMPCIAAVRYVYDEPRIFAYSLLGKKMENIPEHRNICFGIDNILEEDEDWLEICIWGKYKELTDPAEIKASVKNLNRLGGFDPDAVTPKLKAHKSSKSRQNSPVLFRVDSEHITGYSYKSDKKENKI